MRHTTITRATANEAIEGLRESIKDWRAYQEENGLSEKESINDFLADFETVISALQGDVIMIENDGESTNGH